MHLRRWRPKLLADSPKDQLTAIIHCLKDCCCGPTETITALANRTNYSQRAIFSLTSVSATSRRCAEINTETYFDSRVGYRCERRQDGMHQPISKRTANARGRRTMCF